MDRFGPGTPPDQLMDQIELTIATMDFYDDNEVLDHIAECIKHRESCLSRISDLRYEHG